ncbi:MAG: hypothetical protein ACOYVK_03645 [Bacillota bacterium]
MKINLKKIKEIDLIKKSNGTSPFDSLKAYFQRLTKREKILLSVLVGTSLIFGYYRYILSPDLSKVAELNARLEETRTKYNQVLIDISPQNKVHEEYKILNNKAMLLSQRLFPEMIQEKIILVLDGMLKDAGLKSKSISFSEKFIGAVPSASSNADAKGYYLKDLAEQYHGSSPVTPAVSDGNNTEAVNTEQSANNQEDTSKYHLEEMSATLQFEGTYQNLMDFIVKIEDYDKEILIRSVNIANKEDTSMVAGNIILDFYSVEKLHKEDDSFLDWDIQNIYGKDNPFTAYDDYVSGNQKTDTVVENNNFKHDFVMTTFPISSDLPSVMIGKSEDKSMKSYVYADNDGYEAVEFQILQKDNQYYFKYKTQRESYPKNYDNDMVTFTPNGKTVSLNIISRDRNSEEDKNGINLSIVNKTDLKLVVDIDNDPSNKPRVNIASKFGNVIVEK